MKFAYILASDLTHPGITKKIQGQLSAFSKKYATRLIYLKTPFHYLSFHLDVLLSFFTSDVFYIRYNPKVPLINIIAAILSFKKIVIIEHNVKFEIELNFLKRHNENRIHRWTEKVLSNSNCLHVCVTRDILNFLIDKGYYSKNMCYVQNGYQIEKIDTQKINHTTLKNIKTLKKRDHKLLVFVGNHYPWHGLHQILDEIKSLPLTQLLIIGPLEKSPKNLPKNCHAINSCNLETLYSIFDLCDYGFGPYRWDLIGIKEGCPLKSREYLSYGLPIIVNYQDCAGDFDELKPYIYDRRTNEKIIERALSMDHDKTKLKEIAHRVLSWESVLKPVFDHISSKTKSSINDKELS